jgi:hypothetical protein
MYLEPLSLKDKNCKTKKMERIYEALVQVIERVHLSSIQNETLQRVFGFATVGSRSWIFIAQRDYSKLDTPSGKLHEMFDLYPIETASIIPIWLAFNRLAKANFQMCVQSVAFTLAQLLSVLRATNELEILNKLKGASPAGYVIATVSTDSSIGLAINEFDTSFLKNNHVNINTAVGEDQGKTTAISSSVVTTSRFNDPFFNSADSDDCSSEQCIPDAFWWNYRRISVEQEYRAVITRKGCEVLSYCNTAVRQRFREVLQAIHNKRIVHCDLRPNNLMDFDFDVAVDLGEAESVNLKLSPGAQKEFLVHEMGAINKGDNVVEWTDMMDTWMIMKALDSLPSLPVFTIPKKVYESADITMIEADDDGDKEEEEDD